jgi:hypothetical protein
MVSVLYSDTDEVLYLRVSERAVDRTIQLGAGTLVDSDRLRNTVGGEVIRPARSWLDEVLTADIPTPPEQRPNSRSCSGTVRTAVSCSAGQPRQRLPAETPRLPRQ